MERGNRMLAPMKLEVHTPVRSRQILFPAVPLFEASPQVPINVRQVIRKSDDFRIFGRIVIRVYDGTILIHPAEFQDQRIKKSLPFLLWTLIRIWSILELEIVGVVVISLLRLCGQCKRRRVQLRQTYLTLMHKGVPV